jgi:hypothetical protein
MLILLTLWLKIAVASQSCQNYFHNPNQNTQDSLQSIFIYLNPHLLHFPTHSLQYKLIRLLFIQNFSKWHLFLFILLPMVGIIHSSLSEYYLTFEADFNIDLSMIPFLFPSVRVDLFLWVHIVICVILNWVCFWNLS